jgi:hypothetical protein
MLFIFAFAVTLAFHARDAMLILFIFHYAASDDAFYFIIFDALPLRCQAIIADAAIVYAIISIDIISFLSCYCARASAAVFDAQRLKILLLHIAADAEVYY